MYLKAFFFNSLYVLGIVIIVISITHMIMNAINRAICIKAMNKAVEEGRFEVVSDEEVKKMLEGDDRYGK